MDGALRILFLAPHPFYQERGTPIAVDLALRVLSSLGHEVRVLTYPEGEDRAYPGVRIERVRPLFPVRGIRPGFSWKKLVCDAALGPAAHRVAAAWKPHLTHAVEEAVFIARRLQRRYGIPYLYDMDSSMAMQLVEKMPWLRPVAGLFRRLEAGAAREARAVIPVCPALAARAAEYGARRICLLTDVSLLEASPPQGPGGGLKEETGLRGFAFLYIGNLEAYQGIDLLLEAFALAAGRNPDLVLFVVGGPPSAARHYEARARELGIETRVRFPGPRPLSEMGALFQGADALVSPRIRGVNTPMQIYS
ncbi:MAG: glycosyltransferase [Kiritimatiellia bacterium]|nr:glycosyltransferase [Kiritimatiellia bacterium]